MINSDKNNDPLSLGPIFNIPWDANSLKSGVRFDYFPHDISHESYHFYFELIKQ